MAETVENVTFTVNPVGFLLSIMEHMEPEHIEELLEKGVDVLAEVRIKTRDQEIEQLERLATKYNAKLRYLKSKRTPKTIKVAKEARQSAPLPVRFIDPINPENTWTGRGRKPLWLQEYEAQGQSPSEFMVD